MSAPTVPPGEQLWERTLARLEADLERTGRALSAGVAPEVEPWTPPDDPGPLPAHLRERAEQLLQRQTRVIAEATAAAGSLVRQQQVATRMRSGRAGASGAVYVDVRA